jgi:hypothetical protein
MSERPCSCGNRREHPATLGFEYYGLCMTCGYPFQKMEAINKLIGQLESTVKTIDDALDRDQAKPWWKFWS